MTRRSARRRSREARARPPGRRPVSRRWLVLALVLALGPAARGEETVRVSEARAREGDISHAELDKIALEQRGFEREVADAEADRREAVAALLPLVGVEAADVEPVGTLALPPAPEDAAHLASEAFA